jgi:hypothetical protein
MKYVGKYLTSQRIKEAQEDLDKCKSYSDSTLLKEVLREIYSGCCAYCETSPEAGSFSQAEHFYPKSDSRYQHLAKSIENLHYSCQRCNTMKSNKGVEDVFSPNFFLDTNSEWRCSQPEKIDKEIFYIGHLLFSRNLTSGSIDRGMHTIEMFDLNATRVGRRSSRNALVEGRLKHYKKVSTLIDLIVSLLQNYHLESNEPIERLFEMIKSYMGNNQPYAKMIVQNFGSDIIRLLEVYKYKKNATGKLP